MRIGEDGPGGVPRTLLLNFLRDQMGGVCIV